MIKLTEAKNLFLDKNLSEGSVRAAPEHISPLFLHLSLEDALVREESYLSQIDLHQSLGQFLKHKQTKNTNW